MSSLKFDFDPFKATGISRSSIPAEDQANALEEAATLVKEMILENTGKGRTSVEGGEWKRSLTPEYKKVKAHESSSAFANLELTGDMMNAFDTLVKAGKIRLEVSADQADKAEGNLTGSYGRGSPDYSKAREFMPHRRGQKLDSDILDGVREVLERYVKED